MNKHWILLIVVSILMIAIIVRCYANNKSMGLQVLLFILTGIITTGLPIIHSTKFI